MKNNIENIVEKLKELIDINGKDYLTDCPYQVFTELVKSKVTDHAGAGAVLYFLVNGLQKEAAQNCDAEALSAKIKNQCGLNKKLADWLSEIFCMLYSAQHTKEWKEKERAGLRQFLEEEFRYTWEGNAVWDNGGGTIDCDYEAEIVLQPSDKILKDKKLEAKIQKNPYLPKEEIYKIFEKHLEEYLDGEFEDYCSCDDYYPPVVEDFEAASYVRDWCQRNGFEVISCKGDGSDGGYEPKFRRHY